MATQYYCAMSLDGYIARSDDSLDWLTEYEPAEPVSGKKPTGSYEDFYEGVGALVMGSATYEFVLEHSGDWPYAGKPTWVLSSRDLPPPDGESADVRIGPARVVELHEEMSAAAGGGRNLWVVGGGNVASQFADAGLLDEVLVTVVPVVLGGGKPLFEHPPPGGPLKLASTTDFGTGMVELRYQVIDPRPPA